MQHPALREHGGDGDDLARTARTKTLKSRLQDKKRGICMKKNLGRWNGSEADWKILKSLDLELLAENIDDFCTIYPEGMNLLPLLESIGGWDYEYDKHIKEIVQKNLSPTDLTLAQIQSYLTYIIRGERFCDGHIREFVENRALLKLCLRLDDLAQTARTTTLKTDSGAEETHYYRLGSGVLFKINQKNQSCYRLNLETNMWQEDPGMFAEFEWGSIVGYEEIEMDDIYEIAGEEDNRKGPEILVGREENCDVCIHSPLVSRRHALIYYNGVYWLVRDLGSKNGTRLNGKSVSASVLKKGDRIQIGDCVITFYGKMLHLCDHGKTEMVFLQTKEMLDQMIQKQKKSRYTGCLLGGAVGDALGYPVEFWTESQIVSRFGEMGIQDLEQAGLPARISDDTQMTLFAANALIRGMSNNDSDLVSELRTAYCEWLATQGDKCGMDDEKHPSMWIYGDKRLHALRAPGNTCLSAIRSFAKDGTQKFKFAENNSKGCGTVMRAAPFGLAVHYDPAASRGDSDYGVYKGAKYDAMLTHGHAAAYASSVALALMIYEIVQYRPTGRTSLQETISGIKVGQPEVDGLLEKAIVLAQDENVSDLEGIHMLGAGWIAEEALAIAVFCAVRYQNDFAKAIRTAVNHKGDSDSTGAICGNILGAWLGKEAVEHAFPIHNLELEDIITEIASDLYRSVEKGVPLPGTDAEWDKKYR